MILYNDIRKKFTEFFKKNEHKVLSSSPLTPEDSTLLFTNSGMVQFKDYFAGKLESPYKRAVTVQKCVRAGGKHNDLDNVGYTNRHHTFFEMLGNFSFGDYFKEEAISYAWNFLTQEIGVDKSKLYVTVYHTDDEAFKIWERHIQKDRIIRINTNDNFWQVGNVGPCGPCSEIFYDYGASISGGLPGSPQQDGARFTEIWNLVFMQNYIHEDGKITELPNKNIDTGMGLERLISVLEGTVDNYSTSFFKELISNISEITKIIPSKNLFTAGGNISLFTKNDIALRILADHIRSIVFLIADGVLPSNDGRGYVLRRIIRRALKSAYFAGVKSSFLPKIAEALINQMGNVYSQLHIARALILQQLFSEEEKFMELLPRGVNILEKEISHNVKNGILNGEFAFKLYDTYGFPLDITLEIAKEYGVLSIDEKAFENEMQTQQERSKKSWKGTHLDDMEELKKAISHLPKTEFLGYDHTKCTAKVLYSKNGYTVFDKTVFYAESGGQIADTGLAGGISILDVQKIDGRFIHKVSEDIPFDEVHLAVDENRRKKISSNHTATHLLHYVLRKIYGGALVQKGSLVRDDGFRFDFSHSKPLTLAEIHKIEYMVNELIILNSKTNITLTSKEEAQKNGAMALFGEKYENTVRVVSAGESMELCGGIHVNSTGEIGFFKITSQEAVASGVRRIEAKTGIEALQNIHKSEKEVAEIKEKFRFSSSLKEFCENKDAELKNLRNEKDDISKKIIFLLPQFEFVVNNQVLNVKFLEDFTGDLRFVANSMNGNLKMVVNQKGSVFNFCIVGENAKNIALKLPKIIKSEIKFGGNDTFISGGGNGVLKKEDFIQQ